MSEREKEGKERQAMESPPGSPEQEILTRAGQHRQHSRSTFPKQTQHQLSLAGSSLMDLISIGNTSLMVCQGEQRIVRRVAGSASAEGGPQITSADKKAAGHAAL